MHAKSHGWAERAQTYGDILYIFPADNLAPTETTDMIYA